MRDNTPTLLSWARQALGVPLGAIPLSQCRILRPYLLEQRGLKDASTVLMFAVPYVMAEDALSPQRNVSVYAVAEDYHLYFSELSEALIPELTRFFPGFQFAIFSDHSPIGEVEAAALCGLGCVGDHGLLITPEYGSFVFLGEIITDMPWNTATGEVIFTPRDEVPRCEHCGACIAACPGKCLPNSRDTCVSAITQKKGSLTQEEKDYFSRQTLVWGCDICQMSCPHNQNILKSNISTPIQYFRQNRQPKIDLYALQHMSNEDFAKRAYAWRGKAIIERNLILQEGEHHAQIDTGTHKKR
ncbi:MAG: epoxyqueuosine reductase [Ruminococcaceae bacterium]|nr:epoxyqueuosine reductase [Oscillospiraceae bacterium]